MRNSLRSSLAVLGIALLTHPLPAKDDGVVVPASVYEVRATLHVGGEGRWDYVAVDPAAKLLYVPRSTHTQILREATGEIVGDLKDTPGVHGVALAPELNRGFTSNGKTGTVTVFDLKNIAVLGTTKVGENPDAILFDPASKKVFAFNGKSKDATVIDATAAPGSPPVATIKLGGKPEFAATDNAGHVYVNIEDTNSITAIDSNTLKIAAVWKIEGGQEPSGLAIDVAHHRLYAGCGGNNVMAVVDTQSGKTLATVPIGKGVDGCACDPSTGEAFASCGEGVITVVRETAPGTFQATQTVKTRAGARTIVLDPLTHNLYLPTADFSAAKPGEKRPAAKPDSFMIVVVSSTSSGSSPKAP